MHSNHGNMQRAHIIRYIIDRTYALLPHIQCGGNIPGMTIYKIASKHHFCTLEVNNVYLREVLHFQIPVYSSFLKCTRNSRARTGMNGSMGGKTPELSGARDSRCHRGLASQITSTEHCHIKGQLTQLCTPQSAIFPACHPLIFWERYLPTPQAPQRLLALPHSAPCSQTL